MKRYVLAALLLKLTVEVNAYNVTLGHLGVSNPFLNSIGFPTIESTASAINMAVDTFYENGGSRDIHVR